MKNRQISAGCCLMAILVLGALWAQASGHGPVVFESAPLAPGRMTSMMPGTGDFEGILAWRFHRQGTDVGARFESTAFAGIIARGPQQGVMLRDIKKTPGFWAAATTGFASRSHYLWGGAGYQRFAEGEGDRSPDLLFYSLAWAYRPPAWQNDYPHWDWRFFVEMTGERSGRLLHNGAKMPRTGGHQIFVGPTTLGVYKNYAVEGGVQFPVYRDVGARFQQEDLRFAVNFSYFF